MAEVKFDAGKHRRFMPIAGHSYRLVRVFDDATEARAHSQAVKAHYEDVLVEFIHNGEWGVFVRPDNRYPKEVD